MEEKVKMQKLNQFSTLLIAGIVGISLTACAVVSDRETLGEYVDDTGITTKVKTAILNDPSLAPFQIHVETFQNVVQLSGFVDSKQHAAKTQQLAQKVSGVRSVKNNLIVP